jgi:hypothetical protein
MSMFLLFVLGACLTINAQGLSKSLFAIGLVYAVVGFAALVALSFCIRLA